MNGWFVDTSVFLLAIGGEHDDRTAARAFLGKAARTSTRLHASIEAAQEFVSHRLRRTDRATALAQVRSMKASCVLHPFDGEVLDQALRLMDASEVRGRDAVHAAGAIVAGFGTIVSFDGDFDGLPGLTLLHPSAV